MTTWESILELWWNNDVEMWLYAPSKMMKTSSLIGTHGAKMTTSSLMKDWKVVHMTILCSIMW